MYGVTYFLGAAGLLVALFVGISGQVGVACLLACFALCLMLLSEIGADIRSLRLMVQEKSGLNAPHPLDD